MATYNVSGMSCDHCVKSLTSAIKAVAPEATVEVDLQGKKVAVDGFDDAAAIAKAIGEAGFEFLGAA